jgi:hypothetical protein
MRDATNFTPVMLESPFAGDVSRNLSYWKAANLHSIFEMHEAPISSHFYYTQFLDDNQADQRELGIALGYALWARCNKVVFYTDLGMSKGMLLAEKRCVKAGLPFEKRFLGNTWEKYLTRGSSEPFTPAPSQSYLTSVSQTFTRPS